MVARTGFDKGSIILINTVQSLAPSMPADSSNDVGISLKKLTNIIKLKKLNKAGKIYTQKLSSNFIDLKSKKVGINPPEKNMVMVPIVI